MDKEQQLLIDVCKANINGTCLHIDDKINWEKYFILAKNHNLSAISHCVLQENKIKPPQKTSDDFLNSFLDVVFISEKQTQALNEIKALLTQRECPYILFKGAMLRELYPVPEIRSMGDIDLLIKASDKNKIDKALTDAGFKKNSSNGAVDNYERDCVVLEVHTKLSGNPDDNSFDDAFDNAEFDSMTGTLDDSYHLAYMIYHTANHLKYTGAGIRLVMDIAVLIKKKNIDLERVLELVEKSNLTEFAKVILSVSKQWFGYGKIYTENTQKVQQYLIDDGIFGSMKDSVKETIARLRQCGAFENGKITNNSSLALKLKLAFPSYSTLRKADYIKFLDGKPYLLPYAWGYRLAYNLKHRRGNMTQKLKNIDDENTLALAEEELAFFEEIGLE